MLLQFASTSSKVSVRSSYDVSHGKKCNSESRSDGGACLMLMVSSQNLRKGESSLNIRLRNMFYLQASTHCFFAFTPR